MLLKRISIENIRSYEKQEIVFPRGSILLSGDIGTGKTTILLAIEFALFGLQPGQRGTSILRSSNDEGKVILEFEIDEKNVIIERTLKRAKKTVSQDYASIIIDNEKFEESVTEIKNRVLKLLNYPSEFSKKTNLLYKFTVYTPQEEMKQIILEPGDLRLNTLRHVFGIDKYKRIAENSFILTSKLRERIRTNEGMIFDLDALKQELIQRKESLEELKQKKKVLEGEHDKLVQKRIEKEKDLKLVEETINKKNVLENEKSKSLIIFSEKKQQKNSLQNNINSINLQIEESRKIMFKQEELDYLNKKIRDEQDKEDNLQKEYIQIIGQINSEDAKQREIMNLKNKISALKKCPTCLQEVPIDYKTNILSKTNEDLRVIEINLESFNLKRKYLSQNIESVKKNKDELNKKKSSLEMLRIKLDTIKEKEDNLKNLEIQKKSLEKDLELLEKHVESIDSSIVEYSKYDAIFQEKNSELTEAKQKENESAIKKAETNKEIQFSEQQILEKEKVIEKKEELKKKIEKIREMEYWISEKFMNIILFTEKQVMLNLKEEFSKLFSKWFSILVSDSLSAKLDDNFSPIIEQQDYELDYSFLSGGERTSVALAYRLSLNQVINSMLSNIKTTNLVILDEPTDGFSEQQLDKMRDVLDQLNIEQLILVSHEQKIESFVDNVIKIRKENGITRIE
ncbi:MAG: AAA family ATPase [Candidatus Nanoarchaeia archaeon]|nr:AAA family ATPase [Candidatus Nanoarchaeia archaeon]